MTLPEMIVIPAGKVVLGVPAAPPDYSLKHRWAGPREIEVAGFQIGKFPVLRLEYEVFLKETGHITPADWDDPPLSYPRMPACGVSWEDATACCRWLASASGKPFRLPTADEWEKAARGGLAGKKFSWGDENPAGRCCFARSAEAGPEPVGNYPPNGYGLHDLTGLIWEWLQDLYVDIADDDPVNCPTGLPADVNRVLMGGSFMTPNTDPLWNAYRHEDPPDLRHRCLGFRVAL